MIAESISIFKASLNLFPWKPLMVDKCMNCLNISNMQFLKVNIINIERMQILQEFFYKLLYYHPTVHIYGSSHWYKKSMMSMGLTL